MKINHNELICLKAAIICIKKLLEYRSDISKISKIKSKLQLLNSENKNKNSDIINFINENKEVFIALFSNYDHFTYEKFCELIKQETYNDVFEEVNHYLFVNDNDNASIENVLLKNIFSELNSNNTELPISYFKINHLNLSSENFPIFGSLDLNEIEDQLETVYQNFSLEFKKIPTVNLNIFANSLHFLFKKYFTNIPVSTYSNEISLFEYSKYLISISQIINKFRNEETQQVVETEAKIPFILQCIDLSGIQKFIFNISSKYASKSLKGRSFSLQIIIDEIVSTVIQKLDLNYNNLIYSSGGKCFLLLSNNPSTVQSINEIENDLMEAVWKKYNGEIFICFGHVSFKFISNKNEVILESGLSTITNLWKLAAENATAKKYKKFENILLQNFSEFFRVDGFNNGGEGKVCAVTGEELNNENYKSDDGLNLSKSIIEQKNIGENIIKGDLIIFKKNAEFENLIGRRFEFGNYNIQENEKIDEICTLVNGEINLFKTLNGINSFRFYGGVKSAMKNETQPKNFEELTGLKYSNSQANKLGILRMDVDGLGQLFIKGFSNEKMTITSFSQLSGRLDWFFSGYLNTLRNKSDFKDWVNIIYSGGDDIFAVGKWYKIIEFADLIQSEFKKFTGRDDLTISAGITIVSPKFPIAKAAQLAGIAEDTAKDFSRPNGLKKNALNLFGITVGWEEFHEIKDIKEFWIKNCEGDRPVLSKSLLQDMYGYFKIYSKKNLDLSWRWTAAYSLKRHENEKNKIKKDSLDILRMLLLCNQFNQKFVRFESFIVATRWAELLLKNKNI